jgi:hypothetical protein
LNSRNLVASLVVTATLYSLLTSPDPSTSGWFRAVGLGTDKVWFLDYGNVQDVKPENVRKMPERLLEPSPMSHVFELFMREFRTSNLVPLVILFDCQLFGDFFHDFFCNP